MDTSLILLLAGSLLIPIIAKYFFHTTITIQEMLIHFVVVILVIVSVWNVGKWSQTADTEIWNGVITSKHRDHDTYEESYDCNCSTDAKGNRSCSTCWETHYTVDWYAKSTVGNIQFDSEDSTSRSVYNYPNPTQYTNCSVGQPAATEHSYVNYIQAVPQSIFADRASADDFPGKVPHYPRVHDYYQVDHVLNVDAEISAGQIAVLDKGIDGILRELGPSKQANIILVLTEIDDPSYRYAVEQTWLGGKKNDIVIFVGLDGNKITWVDIMTWALNSGNELFHVTLRDKITKQKHLDFVELIPAVNDTVVELYDRPQMKDYKHLEEEITPPDWVVVLAIILGCGGSILLVWFFHVHDVDLFAGRSRRRY